MRLALPDPLSPARATARLARVLQVACLGLLVPLAACEETTEPAPEPVRPVRVTVAQLQGTDDTVSLMGTIEAAETAAMAFRTGGRLLERRFGVGETTSAGDLIGTLESETQRNAVQAARAELSAAQGERDRAETEFERQDRLLERGFATRQTYDNALQALRVARSRVDSAEAQLATAEETLSFTRLYADAPGVVVQVGAEPGEVVGAGQMVVLLAREGGLDAVFDVPERLLSRSPRDPVVTVALVTDPAVRAVGRVREIAPQADPVTRTFRVRVGLIDPPAGLRLGSTITGEVNLGPPGGIEVPATALTAHEGAPAVFVFDPDSGTVALRPVRVQAFSLAGVSIADGLVEGEIVVTAGVNVLRPGQRVRILGDDA